MVKHESINENTVEENPELSFLQFEGKVLLLLVPGFPPGDVVFML